MDVASAFGDAEMSAVRSLVSFGFDFFGVVARRGVWRFPLFFAEAGASDSGER